MIQRLAKLLLSSLLLWLALDIVDSISIERFASIILVVIIITLVSWVLQPLFGLLVKVTGIAGILLCGLFAYGLIVYLALLLTPGITVTSFWPALLVAWLFALLLTIVDWAFFARANDLLVQEAIKNSARHRGPESDKTGFVFVQLDGVSYEVLDMQLRAGNLPNIAKLINKHDYKLRRWTTQLPSTTPASQAGILHGSNAGIPAFRWFDKTSRKLVVANQSHGAASIEKRLSNGRGLLVDGGVSIGNLFSGDATTNIMVMSRVGQRGRSLRGMTKYSSYFLTPYGFMRSLVLSIGEIIKEIYQARRQERLGITPRVHRHLTYAALRAATNVLLRDIQTTIVIGQMMRGVNSLYVDYLDYDEVAHHAGIARPESLQSLMGLDGVVGMLWAAKPLAPRPYVLVFVSDHGQSQGPTFKQLHGGEGLAELVQRLCGASVESAEVESSINDSDPAVRSPDADIVVTGSGNLGNIWFRSSKERLTRPRINRRYPGLIEDLLKTKGIGLLIIQESHKKYVAMGRGGELDLTSGKLTGKDPLQAYAGLTPADLLKLTRNNGAPDIAIISAVKEQTGEVYAFEELVGNHGGAGGWQRDAILLHPGHLKVPKKVLQAGEIRNAEVIYQLFIGWLQAAGQRKQL